MRHKLFIVSILFSLVLLLHGTAGLVAIGSSVPDAMRAQPAKNLDPTPTDSAKLDDLFQQLKQAPNEAQGRFIEADIWQHWSKSGMPKIDSLMKQAKLLAARGHMEPSLGLLDRVVYETPKYVDGWNRRATVLFLMKRDEESLVDIARVLALEPRHFGALAGKVLIKMRRDQWQEALIALRRAIDVHPWLRERHLLKVLEKKLNVRDL